MRRRGGGGRGGLPAALGRRPRDDDDGDFDGDDDGRGVVVVGADAAAVLESMRRSFNCCPICAMPLCVDENGAVGSSDAQWLKAQYCFKGKPSFILQGTGPRNINGFGPVFPLAARRAQSIDACHYVHKHVSDGTTNFRNLWAQCADAETRGADLDMPINTFPGERPKSLPFLQELTVERSIFGETESDGSDMLRPFVFDPQWWINAAPLSAMIQTMTTSTFAGCVDCNSKMTLMDDVSTLFFESFPSVRHESLAQTHYLKNAMMNYMLLQGTVRVDNVFAPPDGGGVRRPFENALGEQILRIVPAQQKTWKMRLGVMWCYFNVFASNLALSRMKPQLAHHSAYIIQGTSDFYLSLLLYLVYVANIPRGLLVVPLFFEEFHRFYAKNIPFYLRHRDLLVSGARSSSSDFYSNSLTNAILGPNSSPMDGTPWNEAPMGLGLNSPNNRNLFSDARSFIGRVHASLSRFVPMHFNPLCGALYNPAHSGLVLDYFARTDRVNGLLRRSNSVPNTVQAYVDLLTADNYWFHFKHVTMAQIAHGLGLSRAYYGQAGDAASVVIDGWARLALGTARALQSSEGRALVGARRCRRITI